MNNVSRVKAQVNTSAAGIELLNAAATGDIIAVKRAIERGANVLNTKDASGNLAVDVANEMGHSKTAKYLSEKMSNVIAARNILRGKE